VPFWRAGADVRRTSGTGSQGLGCRYFFQGAPKNKKQTKKRRTYLPFLRFFEIFRSDFRKYSCGVFGLPLLRNAQKRHKKVIKKKREALTYLIYHLPDMYVAFFFCFLRRPPSPVCFLPPPDCRDL
jgi:hypothetical protein